MMNYGARQDTLLLGRSLRFFGYIINLLVLCINLLVIVLYENPNNRQLLIGCLIIISSVILMIRVRKAKTLFFLISIIGYINTSIAVLDGIYAGEMFSAYQWALRHSHYNQINLKSVLLTVSILSLLITPRMVKKATEHSFLEVERKRNLVISIGGLAFILIALLFGYERGIPGIGGVYVSNAKPIYEYAILVFLIVWFYGKGLKSVNTLLLMCSMVYITQGLYYGDRSSAMVLLALIIMVAINRITLGRMLFFMVFGILSANLIAIIRDYAMLGFDEILRRLLSKGPLLLFSDTASYSFYAGTTIVASRNILPETPLYYLAKFILAVFIGSSHAMTADADISAVVSKINYNAGGGLYPSYFYYWGEFFGVIVGAIILGVVIYTVFTRKTPFFALFQYYLTIMSFRWYLYTPLTFFRTSLLIYSILFGLCFIFDKFWMTHSSANNNPRLNKCPSIELRED